VFFSRRASGKKHLRGKPTIGAPGETGFAVQASKKSVVCPAGENLADGFTAKFSQKIIFYQACALAAGR
jgi:hypothetical protein